MKTKLKEIFRDNIAGVQYGDYQQIKNLKVGSNLKLIWERDNKFDDRAIRLEFKGVKLGYIKKGDNQELLHEYREAKIKVSVIITAINKNNPTWNMFTIKALSNKDLSKSGFDSDYQFA